MVREDTNQGVVAHEDKGEESTWLSFRVPTKANKINHRHTVSMPVIIFNKIPIRITYLVTFSLTKFTTFPLAAVSL